MKNSFDEFSIKYGLTLEDIGLTIRRNNIFIIAAKINHKETEFLNDIDNISNKCKYFNMNLKQQLMENTLHVSSNHKHNQKKEKHTKIYDPHQTSTKKTKKSKHQPTQRKTMSQTYVMGKKQTWNSSARVVKQFTRLDQTENLSVISKDEILPNFSSRGRQGLKDVGERIASKSQGTLKFHNKSSNQNSATKFLPKPKIKVIDQYLDFNNQKHVERRQNKDLMNETPEQVESHEEQKIRNCISAHISRFR